MVEEVGVNISREKIRVGEAIRAPKVRLIDENGGQLGVVEFRQALLKAEEAGLDLVEISSGAEVPVAKIMDFGKYRYEQGKKLQKSRQSQKNQELKGIRLSVKIGKHDFDTKIAKAKEFLAKGNKVALQLRFKGREMAHKDLGEKVLRDFVKVLGDEATVEQEPKILGRGVSMTVAPNKGNKESKVEVIENGEEKAKDA